MYNERKLFTGPFTLMIVTLATADGSTTTTELVGDLCLGITDESNKNTPTQYLVASMTFKFYWTSWESLPSINILAMAWIFEVL